MDAGVTFDPNCFAVNDDAGAVVDKQNGCHWEDQTPTVDELRQRLLLRRRLDSKSHWRNRFVVVAAAAPQHNWRQPSRTPETIDGADVVDFVRVALDHHY
jgi:hypothetical protein